MAEGADLFAHRLVVPPLVLVDGGVMAEGGEAVDAQIGLNNAVRDELIAVVNLYKALGGGWEN